jgi:NitT/TauT family transport system ATP-binding protein
MNMVMAAPIKSSANVGVSLSLAGVCKTFDGSVQAVAELSLEAPAGQFLALLGPSGCGKSTLLRMIAGLESIDSGRILVNDQPVMPRHRQSGMAFVFQDAHLLPWRNVLGNVELPLELMGQNKVQRREQAARAIADVGLAEAAGRYPMQLSGGMRMRVSLARALVTRPKLLLLDEPFAALDELTRHRLDEQLLQLWQQSGMTVLFVTHSISEAAFLSERAVVLSARPARVVADLAVKLGKQRGPELRTDQRFVEVMREIQQALRGDEP